MVERVSGAASRDAHADEGADGVVASLAVVAVVRAQLALVHICRRMEEWWHGGYDSEISL